MGGESVNIVEAIKATDASHPYIRRKAWNYPTPTPGGAAVKILPTDSPDCCVVSSRVCPSRSAPRWNPAREDLIAEDWEPVR